MISDGSTRDAQGRTHSAVNWQGNLDSLTKEQLDERARALAWWIASEAAASTTERGKWRRGLEVDVVAEFRKARNAWLAK